MTLHYHGERFGYVDSNDREELDAIASILTREHRERRIESRIGRPLMYHEAMALQYCRNARDRLAELAERRRRGLRP